MASDNVEIEQQKHYIVEVFSTPQKLERRVNELYRDHDKPYYLYLLTEGKESYTAVFAEVRERARR
jgi:hypothetical protein